MKTHKNSSKYLCYFFILTLLWTWGFGFAPIVLGIRETALGTFLFYFGGGAPSVVGLFFVLLTYTSKERKDYFHRCFSLRKMGIKWIILLVLFFTFIAFIGIYIGVNVMHAEMPQMLFLKIIIGKPYMFLVILLISIISGPLNEEFGWRGYALDKLIKKYGFYGGSIILGFIWAIWHLPWYFTPGQAQYDLVQNSLWEGVLFIPSTMLLSIVVSFVYISTNRSILAGAMTHMLSNLLTSQLISPYTTEISTSIRYVHMLFCGIVVVYTLFSGKFQERLLNNNFYIQHEKVL